jgi:hypothetical protein
MRCGSGLLNDITTLIPRDRSLTLHLTVLKCHLQVDKWRGQTLLPRPTHTFPKPTHTLPRPTTLPIADIEAEGDSLFLAAYSNRCPLCSLSITVGERFLL